MMPTGDSFPCRRYKKLVARQDGPEPAAFGTILIGTNSLVNLKIDRQKVKSSPAYDDSTMVDGAYEKRFHDHYDDILAPGRP